MSCVGITRCKVLRENPAASDETKEPAHLVMGGGRGCAGKCCILGGLSVVTR